MSASLNWLRIMPSNCL